MPSKHFTTPHIAHPRSIEQVNARAADSLLAAYSKGRCPFCVEKNQPCSRCVALSKRCPGCRQVKCTQGHVMCPPVS